jgi:hypothetical protein
MSIEKEIRSNEDFIAKALNIGVSVDEIMAEFNAYDWMELNHKPLGEFIIDFKKRTNFDSRNDDILEKAFHYKFERAIKNISALIEEVNSSYNIPTKAGISNAYINKYYYIKYWADKKNIAINYNEKDFNKRNLFNFYTILFDIFANKLDNFNCYNRQQNA